MKTKKKQGCFLLLGVLGIGAMGLSWGCTEMPDYMRGEEHHGLAVMAAQLAQGAVHESGDGVRETKPSEAKVVPVGEHEMGKTAVAAGKADKGRGDDSLPAMPVVTLSQAQTQVVRNTESIPVTPY